MSLIDQVIGDKPVQVEVGLEKQTVVIIGILIVTILVATFLLIRSANCEPAKS